MRKTVFFLLFAVTLFLCLITCSKLDSSTSTGIDVVKEYDPSLTRYDENFHAVQFDTSIVTGSRSLPNSGTKGYGYHSNKLAVGTFNQMVLYGSIRFYFTHSFASYYDSTKTLTSVSFLLDTIADSARKRTYSDEDSLFFYTSTAESKFIESAEDTTKTPIAIFSAVTDDSTLKFTADLSGSTIEDSILSLLNIFSECNTCGGEIDSNFYFSLFSNTDDICWFHNDPAIIIHWRKDDDNTDYADTVYGTSHFIAIESDTLIQRLSPLPVSTYLSCRTAVFEMSMSALWDSLEHSSYNELLAAGILLKPDSIFSEETDSISVRYLFFDSLITDEDTLADIFEIEQAYGLSKAVNLSQQETNSVTISIGSHLQKRFDSKPEHFYLYLQIISSDIITVQEMYWDKPQIKAILTTIK